jgi:prevent-host-death family protein
MNEESIERARLKLGEVVDRARFADQFTVITRQGKPAAVVVSVEWLEHTRSALAAYTGSDDPPVSAREVRKHVTHLGGLLDGMRKLTLTGDVQEYWKQLQDEVADLAGLLPENAEGDSHATPGQ